MADFDPGQPKNYLRELDADEKAKLDKHLETFRGLDNNNQLRYAYKLLHSDDVFAIKGEFICSEDFKSLIDRNGELLQGESKLERIIAGEDL